MVIKDVSGQPLVLDVQLVLEHLLLILGIKCQPELNEIVVRLLGVI